MGIAIASESIVQKNTFSPKNDSAARKILWIEPEALRLCLNKDSLKLEEVIVLEEFGR